MGGLDEKKIMGGGGGGGGGLHEKKTNPTPCIFKWNSPNKENWMAMPLS